MSSCQIVAVCLVNGSRQQVDDFYVPLLGWSAKEAAPTAVELAGSRRGWVPVVETDDPTALVTAAKDLGGGAVDTDVGSLVTDPAGAGFLVYGGTGDAPGLAYQAGSRRPGRPSWVQLNSVDPDSSAVFLEAVLGFGLGPSNNDKYTYWQLVNDRRSPHGGLMKIDARSGDVPPMWQVYFHSHDVPAAATAIEDAGGDILVPPTTITAGDFLVGRDPEGTVFAIDDMQLYLVEGRI